MSSTYGQNLRFTIFGQSHSPAIGVTVEGLPVGFPIDMDALAAFLRRRAPGQNAWSTPRKEADLPEFICGLKDGITCGVPLTALIHNTNTRSQDYAPFADRPRPGHADYTASVKYNGAQDSAGGGHFSGRLTAPLCIAGGIAIQLLQAEGISVRARIYAIAGIRDEAEFCVPVSEKVFPVVTDSVGADMQAAIAQARSEQDSVGGIVECIADGIPAGLGDPMFDGMENRIAQIIFGIPAVKGLEFGAGFGVTEMRGSENNDSFYMDDGSVRTRTNHCGGILGGITDGMPVVFRTAFKPTPSISRVQQTVSLSSGTDTYLEIAGRHDPCIVPRAVPVVEAAAALALYDALLDYRKYSR